LADPAQERKSAFDRFEQAMVRALAMARPIPYALVRSPPSTWKGLGREGQRRLEPGRLNVVVVYYAIVGSSRQTMLTWLVRTTRRNCTLQRSKSRNHRNESRRGSLLVVDSSPYLYRSSRFNSGSFIEIVLRTS